MFPFEIEMNQYQQRHSSAIKRPNPENTASLQSQKAERKGEHGFLK